MYLSIKSISYEERAVMCLSLDVSLVYLHCGKANSVSLLTYVRVGFALQLTYLDTKPIPNEPCD